VARRNARTAIVAVPGNTERSLSNARSSSPAFNERRELGAAPGPELDDGALAVDGKYTQALPALQQAFQRYQALDIEIDSGPGSAGMLTWIGEAQVATHNFPEALKNYEKADDISRKLTELEKKARLELNGSDALHLIARTGEHIIYRPGQPALVLIDVDTKGMPAAVKERIDAMAETVAAEAKIAVKYQVGTIIELPRAALKAGEIAETAEFFSFGTNDLTQTTFGISRDDVGKILTAYLAEGILKQDPFVTIDQQGVGQLIKMAVEKGRKTRPTIKLGICGEHGGDPASVEFCAAAGLNYVSCSPYRVLTARLAAAQAGASAELQIEGGRTK
jgi:hypothetical protein